MLCQFTISPLGYGESLSSEVSKIIDLIDKSGLPYQTHSMGTIVEGSWEEVMALIQKCHNTMLARNARVSTTIHIDDRKNSNHRIKGKITSIENHLGRTISK
ncbi:MTH1187 family thiamine-binding protein [bacterium]|nr:MTH1187 family thiamine-binding protein [candidate division CSSED10-310 bacterium]